MNLLRRVLNAIKAALQTFSKPDTGLMQIKFYRDPDRRWYVDLPNWTGTKGELQMVCGADELLELVGDCKSIVYVDVSLVEVEGFRKLTHFGDGVYATDYEEVKHVWLCSVTKFVFGEYPREIYFKASES